MIIGLVGFIGAGKGTVGEYLHMEGYHQGSFAGALKDTASTLFGWERELLEGDTVESRNFRESIDGWWSNRFGYDFTPRMALQLLGTEAGRNVFHPDVWIYSLEKRIEGLKDVVLTDTRFPNEIEFIRSKGGIIIEVVRGERPDWYRLALEMNKFEFGHNQQHKDLENKVHISERAWIGQKVDYTIQNNGTLDDLLKNIRSVLTELKNNDTMVTQLNNGETNEIISRHN
jgi:hypothetical protein